MRTSTSAQDLRTLPELLAWRAARTPDAPMVRTGDVQVTFGDFAARTDAVAAGLAQLGIAAGDVVSVLLPNRLELLEAWWAVVKLGAVFNPVNTGLTAREVAHVVGDAGAVCVITDAAGAARIEARRDELPALRDVVCVDGAGSLAFAALRTTGSAAPVARVDPSDLAALVYTSGTTGRPKGAMLSHGNYVSDLAMIAEVVPLRRGDVLGLVLPLFHVTAQMTVTVPMLARACVAMWERFDAATFWDAAAAHRLTAFSAVPTILAALLDAPGADQVRYSSLEYVICGAAPLAPDLLARFEEQFGLRVLEGYGLTEGTCASAFTRSWGPRKPGSIGRPLRGQGLQVRTPAGRRAAVGEPGELWLSGPNVMQGYLGLPEATATTLVDGWLATGDIGYVDEDGFVFLVDRAKDLIIHAGENVYAREVEEVLGRHPAVRDVAVIARPDPLLEEGVHAVVTFDDGEVASWTELIAYCREQLAAFKVPSSFEVVDDLPRTATGKVDKQPLRAALARQRDAG